MPQNESLVNFPTKAFRTGSATSYWDTSILGAFQRQGKQAIVSDAAFDSKDFVQNCCYNRTGHWRTKALNRRTKADPPFADIDLRLSVLPGHGSLLLDWLLSNEPGAEAHRSIVVCVRIRHQEQGASLQSRNY